MSFLDRFRKTADDEPLEADGAIGTDSRLDADDGPTDSQSSTVVTTDDADELDPLATDETASVVDPTPSDVTPINDADANSRLAFWRGLPDGVQLDAFVDELSESIETMGGGQVDAVKTGSGTTCLFFTRGNGHVGAIDLDADVAAGWPFGGGEARVIDPSNASAVSALVRGQ